MYTSFLYSVTKRSSRTVIFTMRTHTDITTQTEDSHPSGSQDITTCRWNPLHLTENRVHFASGIVTQVQNDFKLAMRFGKFPWLINYNITIMNSNKIKNVA